MDNPDSWRRIADYLEKERVEAVGTLENRDPSDPSWWADRVEWIDSVASKISDE
jgi:hypothetical protein